MYVKIENDQNLFVAFFLYPAQKVINISNDFGIHKKAIVISRVIILANIKAFITTFSSEPGTAMSGIIMYFLNSNINLHLFETNPQ